MSLLRSSQFYAEVYQAGAHVATLDLTGGTVTQKFNAAARRTCDLEFTAWGSFSGSGSIIPDIVPAGSKQKFGDLTFGANVFGDDIYETIRGLIVPLSSTVKVFGMYGLDNYLLGTFTIGDPTWEVRPEGVTVSVSGWDIAGDIAASRFDQTTRGFEIAELPYNIKYMLNSRVLPAGVDVVLPASTITGGDATYVPGCGTNPWQAAQEYADLAGWQLYVTRTGAVITVAQQPNPDNYPAPSQTLSDTDNLFSLSLTTTSRELCNVVVVSGDSLNGTPTWAKAESLNGPYGVLTTGKRIVREFSSDKATTQADCQNLANIYLRKWSRLAETVTGTCTPLPGTEVGETVRIVSSDLDFKTNDVFFLESLEIPLDGTSPSTFTASRRLK